MEYNPIFNFNKTQTQIRTREDAEKLLLAELKKYDLGSHYLNEAYSDFTDFIDTIEFTDH